MPSGRATEQTILVLCALLTASCHREARTHSALPDPARSTNGPFASSSGFIPEPVDAATTLSKQGKVSAARTSEERELHHLYDGSPALQVLRGKAAYYGDALAGNKTANGEVYDPKAFTAAHRSLPFNTIVRVVRQDNERHTYVRITDRGPFGDRHRIIDLSKIAAQRLEMIRAGVVDVKVEVVARGDGRRAR